MVTAAMKLKDACFLGGKAMTNIVNILKSKDITLLMKVHLVKAMIFPVVMYEYENWIKKKERKKGKGLSTKELMLSNCGADEDS